MDVPIGNETFCNNFILKILKSAVKCSNVILDGLESDQTILQLFKICTVHKLTRLFASDVIDNTEHNLTNNWNVWGSDMTRGFNDMTSSFKEKLTRNGTLPNHSILISSMATKAGDLSIQNPQASAIPTLILTTKCNIQYATDGIWKGDTVKHVALSPIITSLAKKN